MDLVSVRNLQNRLFDLAESLLDDKEGIKESSLDLLKEVHIDLRPDLPAPQRRRWNDLMKKVDSMEGRFFTP